MTNHKKMIENLFGDTLYLENRVKDRTVLNDYDCEIITDIVQHIYEVIRILKTTEND